MEEFLVKFGENNAKQTHATSPIDCHYNSVLTFSLILPLPGRKDSAFACLKVTYLYFLGTWVVFLNLHTAPWKANDDYLSAHSYSDKMEEIV